MLVASLGGNRGQHAKIIIANAPGVATADQRGGAALDGTGGRADRTIYLESGILNSKTGMMSVLCVIFSI